jgi:hypothetical protein
MFSELQLSKVGLVKAEQPVLYFLYFISSHQSKFFLLFLEILIFLNFCLAYETAFSEV